MQVGQLLDCLAAKYRARYPSEQQRTQPQAQHQRYTSLIYDQNPRMLKIGGSIIERPVRFRNRAVRFWKDPFDFGTGRFDFGSTRSISERFNVISVSSDACNESTYRADGREHRLTFLSHAYCDLYSYQSPSGEYETNYSAYIIAVTFASRSYCLTNCR